MFILCYKCGLVSLFQFTIHWLMCMWFVFNLMIAEDWNKRYAKCNKNFEWLCTVEVWFLSFYHGIRARALSFSGLLEQQRMQVICMRSASSVQLFVQENCWVWQLRSEFLHKWADVVLFVSSLCIAYSQRNGHQFEVGR